MLRVHESRRGWRAERGQPAGFSAFRPCVSPTEGAWAGEVQLKGMVHRNVGPGMWASAWSVFPPSFTLERNRLKRHVSPERKGWCDAHTFVYLHPLGAACGASPPHPAACCERLSFRTPPLSTARCGSYCLTSRKLSLPWENPSVASQEGKSGQIPWGLERAEDPNPPAAL